MSDLNDNLMPLTSIKNGCGWFLALFPLIFLVVSPLINIVLAESGVGGFFWSMVANTIFQSIYNIYFLWKSDNDFLEITHESPSSIIGWLIPGVFLYNRSAIIQRIYKRRIPYLEAMWWTWFAGILILIYIKTPNL